MDARRQLQCFAGRQPRTPQAESLVGASPLCPRRPEWPPVLGLQTTERRSDGLQMPESLLALLLLCRWIKRCAFMGLLAFMHGDVLMLGVMPEPPQRRHGHRRGVERPAAAALPPCYPPPHRSSPAPPPPRHLPHP